MNVDYTGEFFKMIWQKIEELFVNIGDAFVTSIEAEVRFGPGVEVKVYNQKYGYSHDYF